MPYSQDWNVHNLEYDSLGNVLTTTCYNNLSDSDTQSTYHWIRQINGFPKDFRSGEIQTKKLQAYEQGR